LKLQAFLFHEKFSLIKII